MIDVKYPSAEMKEGSIESIVKDTKKHRVNPIRFLVDVYREIGFSAIFKNTIGVYFLSAVIYVAFMVFALTNCYRLISTERVAVNMYALFFFASPLIMLISNALYVLTESPKEDYEYKLTCKYNTHQIELIKMPFLAVLTMVINSVCAICWCLLSGYNNLFSMLGVSAFSILLYGIMGVVMYNSFRRYAGAVCLGVWLVLNVILLRVSVTAKIVLFVGIPAVAHIVVVTVLVVVFAKIVQKSYFKKVSLRGDYNA